MRTFLVTLLFVSCTILACSRSSGPNSSVIFLIDASDSVPEAQQRRIIRYVNRAAQLRGPMDEVGVIAFGREPHFEIPLGRHTAELPPRIEAAIDGAATDIAAAIDLAADSFSSSTRNRIVLFTDGNETSGDAVIAAKRAADRGIGLDIVPIRYSMTDVALVDIAVPTRLKAGEPAEIRLTMEVRNALQPVTGVLRLTELRSTKSQVVARREITLAEGTTEVAFAGTVIQPDTLELRAQYLPLGQTPDAVSTNNEASTLVPRSDAERVLILVADTATYEAFRTIEGEAYGIDIRDVRSWNLSELAQLQKYSAVVLADVPRRDDDVPLLSDRQIRLLSLHAEINGAGLIVCGASRSFGAGDWGDSELDRALPVQSVTPRDSRLAAALVMYGTRGQQPYWNKVVCREFLKKLGPDDSLGIVHGEEWLWPWQVDSGVSLVGHNKDKMLALIDQMRSHRSHWPLEKQLEMAIEALESSPAAQRRILLFGDYQGPTVPSRLLDRMRKGGIQLVVGETGREQRLLDMTKRVDGRYFSVRNPKTAPRIAQKTAMSRHRPIERFGIHKFDRPAHPLLSGIEALAGGEFACTELKNDGDAAQIASTTVDDVFSSTYPLIVTGKHGRGRTVAMMTSLFSPYSRIGPDTATRLLRQMIQWAKRGDFANEAPTVTAATPGLQVNSSLEGSECIVVAPDLTTIRVPLRRRSATDHVGTLTGIKSGRYIISVATDQRVCKPLHVIATSPESDACETDFSLLKELLGSSVSTSNEMLELSVGRSSLSPFR